jgi:hypothetical protein
VVSELAQADLALTTAPNSAEHDLNSGADAPQIRHGYQCTLCREAEPEELRAQSGQPPLRSPNFSDLPSHRESEIITSRIQSPGGLLTPWRRHYLLEVQTRAITT